jgi:transketolase
MGNITDVEILKLQKKANKVRKLTIESLMLAGSGHTAGSLGMADIFTYLYFHELKHKPKNPNWPERDLFILSNGHICPGLYATMALAGYFPILELKTLRKFGSRFQGHPHRAVLPGIETSSGPLGSGISQAIGMALGIRIEQKRTSSRFVYCVVGDGELNEGQNWEAIMLASKYKIHNLIVIVDRNNIQIDGYTEDVMPLENLQSKFESFNWHVQQIDGHNFEMIDDAIGQSKAVFNKPSVIIANTIPGKGVQEFERKPEWHGKSPNEKEAKIALRELRTIGGKIECEQIN